LNSGLVFVANKWVWYKNVINNNNKKKESLLKYKLNDKIDHFRAFGISSDLT
jgi:hypothetical protein